MGWLTKLQQQAPTKAAGDFTPIDSFRINRLPNSRFPYGRSVKDGLDSNVVMAPVNWILRNFTEAELRMQRRTKRMWQPLEDHDVVRLIDRPNKYYDGDLLWKATLISYVLDGNGYWLKVRNAFDEPIQLFYLPHFLVTPKGTGKELISHYEYRPWWGAPKVDIPVRDMIHLRFGLDPRDMKRGLAPLKPLLREIFTDDEAANFSATILRNMGVPGGVIAPKDGAALPDPDDIEEMREYMKTAFSGDRRGEWLVLGTPTETSQFGFDPNQLMIGNLRDIAEERVCATLGIPAAVVGFGAGLQQTKVGATMKELRRLAWTSCLQPMQRSLARQVSSELIPEFQTQERRFRLWFDVSSVPAFQEEETELARRVDLLVKGGILRVDRGQEMLGLEVDENQAVYLRPMGSIAVPADGSAPEPPPNSPPSPNGNGSGGGGGDGEETEEEVINRARAALVALHKRGY